MPRALTMFTSYLSSSLLRFLKRTLKTWTGYFPFTPLLESADSYIDEKCSTEHPDSGISIFQLVTNYGYPVEKHEVTTNDGYILTLLRIPHGRHPDSSKETNKRCIFLQHGLLGSCADYLVNCPEKSLAFLLADSGFDVWLGNSRGNKYSKKHISLSIKSRKYWEFSQHEMGIYDVPACIDKALEVSGQSSLSYIGHSQGCGIFFICMSTYPEYNNKIDINISLGPATYVSNMISPLRFFAPICAQFEDIIGLEFMPSGGVLELLGHCLGIADQSFQELYYNLFFLICGFNVYQLNRKQLPIILQHLPSSTSYRNIVYFSQCIMAKEFKAYDHGSSAKNLEKYGKPEPPKYHLSKVTCPTAIFYGENDWLIVPKDIDRLASELPGLVGKYKIEKDPLFNHLDFLLGKDADKLLYKDVLRILADF